MSGRLRLCPLKRHQDPAGHQTTAAASPSVPALAGAAACGTGGTFFTRQQPTELLARKEID